MSNSNTEIRDLPFSGGWTVRMSVVPTIHFGVLVSAEEVSIPASGDGKKKSLFIKPGAILYSCGCGDEVRWIVVNRGYYAAARIFAAYIPGTCDREQQDIRVYQDVLDAAIELTWCTVSSSPQEMKDRYEKLMRSLTKWRRPRLETKRQVIKTIGEASTLFDRRGHFNPTSRSPMVLSAALIFRRRSNDLVSICNDTHGRLAALIVLKNRAWKFLNEIERILRQSKSRWHDGRSPSRKVAEGHARRFRDFIQFFEELYVAPFGRRTLLRLKWDFQHIVDVLEAERYDEAFELISMALNSIYLVRVRADMEDALLKLTQLIESGADSFARGEQGDFYTALYEFRKLLEKPDLEKGFANQVLLKVLSELDLAIAEAKKLEPNLKLLRSHLKKACEPI